MPTYHVMHTSSRGAESCNSAVYPDDAAASVGAELVVGSGADTLVSARGSGTALDALPRAADARLLPLALRSLAARPIYGRAPDAKPQP